MSKIFSNVNIFRINFNTVEKYAQRYAARYNNIINLYLFILIFNYLYLF